MFQSRNRESYLFKRSEGVEVDDTAFLFQSRNRESYLFKTEIELLAERADQCFNLVIENLIFSSALRNAFVYAFCLFQSRNRESYLFKFSKIVRFSCACVCFNLVIENLIFSRTAFAALTPTLEQCFNLVIENLIFSRIDCPLDKGMHSMVSIS